MSKKIESVYIYGGTSDECGGPTPNEDYFTFKVLAPDVLLIAIADGMGGKPSESQPAAIGCLKAVETVERLYKMNSEIFFSDPTMMLCEAIHVANNILGAFKISNEEMHAGFAASITLVLMYGRDKFCFAHCGNCRLHVIRIQQDGSPKTVQLTRDHTKAAEQFDEGIITADEFTMHPDRYTLTSCIGVISNPEIQASKGKMKPNDIFVLTTDGIHYSIRPDAMTDIVLSSSDWYAATQSLIQGAKMEHVNDNATAVFFINPKE